MNAGCLADVHEIGPGFVGTEEALLSGGLQKVVNIVPRDLLSEPLLERRAEGIRGPHAVQEREEEGFLRAKLKVSAGAYVFDHALPALAQGLEEEFGADAPARRLTVAAWRRGPSTAPLPRAPGWDSTRDTPEGREDTREIRIW